MAEDRGLHDGAPVPPAAHEQSRELVDENDMEADDEDGEGKHQQLDHEVHGDMSNGANEEAAEAMRNVTGSGAREDQDLGMAHQDQDHLEGRLHDRRDGETEDDHRQGDEVAQQNISQHAAVQDQDRDAPVQTEEQQHHGLDQEQQQAHDPHPMLRQGQDGDQEQEDPRQDQGQDGEGDPTVAPSAPEGADSTTDSGLAGQAPPPPPPPPPRGAAADIQEGQAPMQEQSGAPLTTKIPRLKKRCLCDKDMCKVLTSVFSQLGDIRGGFVELPSKDAKNQRELNAFSRARWLATLSLTEEDVRKGKDKRLSKAHFPSSRFDGKRLVRWKPATDLTPQANLFTKDLKDFEVTVPEVSQADMKSMLDQFMVERVVFPTPDTTIHDVGPDMTGTVEAEHIHHHHHHHHHHHDENGNMVGEPHQHRHQDAGDMLDSGEAPSGLTSGNPLEGSSGLNGAPMPPSSSSSTGAGAGASSHDIGDDMARPSTDTEHMQRRRGDSTIGAGSGDAQGGSAQGMPISSAVQSAPASHESVVKSQYAVLASALNRRQSGPTTIQLLDVGQGAIKELHSTRRAMQDMERENKQLKAEVQRLSAALQDRIEASERIAKTLRREISVLETRNEALSQKNDKDRDRLDRYKRRIDDLSAAENAAGRSKKRVY